MDHDYCIQVHCISMNIYTCKQNCKYKILPNYLQGIPYEINEDIEVVATPGHTITDVSVIVRNTANGIVAITGT